jgi:hypothetical protein
MPKKPAYHGQSSWARAPDRDTIKPITAAPPDPTYVRINEPRPSSLRIVHFAVPAIARISLYRHETRAAHSGGHRRDARTANDATPRVAEWLRETEAWSRARTHVWCACEVIS